MAFGNAWAAQGRALSAAFYTDIHELSANMGLKFFLRFLEPFIVLGVALCWHTLLNAQPPYGTSRVLFLVSGYYPVHLVVEVASGFWIASKRGARLRRYPVETMLDQVIVGAFVETCLYVFAGFLGFYLLYIFFSHDALPANGTWIAVSLFEMVSLGFACGLFNAFVQQHVKYWRDAWIGISRALILFSGIFYVPSFLPLNVRDVMAWNPAMQGVEAFRYGIYPGYPMLSYFPAYFWSFTIIVALIGLVGDRVFRRYAKQ